MKKMRLHRNMKSTISSFIDFLHKFNTVTFTDEEKRKNNGSNDLYGVYGNGCYSLAIVPIGRQETIHNSYYGYEPYTEFTEKAIRQGIKTFYFLARGRVNVYIADIAARELEKMHLARMTDRYVEKVGFKDKVIEIAYLRLESLDSKDYAHEISSTRK